MGVSYPWHPVCSGAFPFFCFSLSFLFFCFLICATIGKPVKHGPVHLAASNLRTHFLERIATSVVQFPRIKSSALQDVANIWWRLANEYFNGIQRSIHTGKLISTKLDHNVDINVKQLIQHGTGEHQSNRLYDRCDIAYHPPQLDTRHYTLMKAIAATGKETKISSPTTEKVAEK